MINLIKNFLKRIFHIHRYETIFTDIKRSKVSGTLNLTEVRIFDIKKCICGKIKESTKITYTTNYIKFRS